MNFAKRKTVYADLQDYCYHSKPHEIVEVTEWTNGEGWDITIGTRTLQLTMGELQAIEVLTKIVHPKD